jgi:hypothetical protein
MALSTPENLDRAPTSNANRNRTAASISDMGSAVKHKRRPVQFASEKSPKSNRDRV